MKITSSFVHKTSSIAVALALVASAVGPFAVRADLNDPFDGAVQSGNIPICHNGHPVGPNFNSIVGGTGHGGHGSDIIPPFNYPDGSYPGQNWTEENITLWNDGECDGVAVVDVCANIEGDQDEVPEDLVQDGDDCVEPVVEAEDGTVVVEKVVNGGSAVPGDFSFEVKDGSNATVFTDNFDLNDGPNPWQGPNKGRNVVVLPAGTYTIIEVPTANYSAFYADGGAPNSPGQPCTVTITAGTTPGNGSVNCDIVNTYQPPVDIDDACPNDDGIQASIDECSTDNEPEMCSITVVSDSTNLVDASPAVELTSTVNAAWASIFGAKWIWSVEPVADATVNTSATFTKTFVWNGPVTNAVLDLAVDNSYIVKINDTQVAISSDPEFNYGSTVSIAIPDGVIVDGLNTITFEATNLGVANTDGMSNPAGIIYKLSVEGTDEDCDTDDGDNDLDRFTLNIETSGEGAGKIMGTGISCDSNASTPEEIEINDCSETYDEGTDVELTVTTDEGSSFADTWATGFGGCIDHNTPCTVKMTQNVTLNAHLSLSGNNGGGGGGGSSNRSSRGGSGGGNDDGEVLGAQTEIMPDGAPNTGAGGMAGTGAAGILLAALSLIGLASRKFI